MSTKGDTFSEISKRSPNLLIKKIEKKKHSVISLWDQTNKLAKEEDKTTVITLCQKHRPGFWIVCHEDDLDDQMKSPKGYFSNFSYANKKGYSGVGIYSKEKPNKIITSNSY